LTGSSSPRNDFAPRSAPSLRPSNNTRPAASWILAQTFTRIADGGAEVASRSAVRRAEPGDGPEVRCGYVKASSQQTGRRDRADASDTAVTAGFETERAAAMARPTDRPSASARSARLTTRTTGSGVDSRMAGCGGGCQCARQPGNEADGGDRCDDGSRSSGVDLLSVGTAGHVGCSRRT
jgi:hypothetical protein